MSDIQIILGDAIVEIRKIPTGSVDVVIADPPYNLGKDYGNSSDSYSFDEYISFSNSWLEECQRVLKDSGTIYVLWVSGSYLISTIFWKTAFD